MPGICGWCKYPHLGNYYTDWMINGVYMYRGICCRDCYVEFTHKPTEGEV